MLRRRGLGLTELDRVFKELDTCDYRPKAAPRRRDQAVVAPKAFADHRDHCAAHGRSANAFQLKMHCEFSESVSMIPKSCAHTSSK